MAFLSESHVKNNVHDADVPELKANMSELMPEQSDHAMVRALHRAHAEAVPAQFWFPLSLMAPWRWTLEAHKCLVHFHRRHLSHHRGV